MDIRSTKLEKINLTRRKESSNARPSKTASRVDTIELGSSSQNCCEKFKERIVKAEKKLNRGLWGYVGGSVGTAGACVLGDLLGQAYGDIGWVAGGILGGTFAVVSVALGADVRRTALQERHRAFEDARQSGCFKPGELMDWFYEEVSDTRVDVG